MALVTQAGKTPAPNADPTNSGAQTAGSGFNPAPTTPTPQGMALYRKIQARAAKKAATASKRAGKNGVKGPVSAPNDPSGTGGPNDPAWQHLADLYKNGLPG